MATTRVRLIELLDAFQAAERAGAAALGCWIRTCTDPRLRGGLRVVRARDLRHADLTEARLRALGGVPRSGIGRELAALCTVIADAGVSDHSKLALLVGRLPGADGAPLAEFLRETEDDPETYALVEAIGQDERLSLRWLHDMHASFGEAA